MDDRVVQEVHRQLQQKRLRADVGVTSPAVLDGDATRFREGQQRLGGFLRDERQVDALSGERSLVGAAEQEQRLGEFDRSGVHGGEPVE